MNVALARNVGTLLLAGIALLAWRQWWQRDAGSLTNEHRPDSRGYYLTSATLRQTASDGQARYTLRADHIEQDLQDQRIHLQRVQLDFRSDTGTQWLLSADQGSLDEHQQQVAFKGNVRVQPGATDNATLLETQSLLVDLTAQKASTNDPVTMKMNGHTLSATGMLANLQQQRVRLEARVQGLFRVPATGTGQ